MTQQGNLRLLHRIEHSLGVDLHLQPRDYAQEPQRGRRREPLVVRLVPLDGPDISGPVDDVHGQDAADHDGVLPERGPVGAHGHAAAEGDVPVNKACADVGTAGVEVVGELEEGHARLDDHRA